MSCPLLLPTSDDIPVTFSQTCIHPHALYTLSSSPSLSTVREPASPLGNNCISRSRAACKSPPLQVRCTAQWGWGAGHPLTHVGKEHSQVTAQGGAGSSCGSTGKSTSWTSPRHSFLHILLLAPRPNGSRLGPRNEGLQTAHPPESPGSVLIGGRHHLLWGSPFPLLSNEMK